jgi:hypothetical protein
MNRPFAPFADFPVFSGVTVNTTAQTIKALIQAASTTCPSGVREVQQINAVGAAAFYVVDQNGGKSGAVTEALLPYSDIANTYLQGVASGDTSVTLEISCSKGGNSATSAW